ncbi:anti-sigma-I factor RsgI family protein [Metabacillus herbersteinensis]
MIFFTVLPIFNEDKVYAYMTIDINPSFELAVDNRLRVVTLEPMNDDGKKLLEELVDWEKKPFNTLVNQIVLESKEAGYIQKGKEIFITTVYAQDRKQIKDDLLEDIAELRSNYEKEDMKLKAIETDQSTRDKAMRQGISTGKYLQLQLKQEIEEPKVEEPEIEKEEPAASQPEEKEIDDTTAKEQTEKTTQSSHTTDAKKKLEEAQQKLKESSKKLEQTKKPHPNGKDTDEKSNPGHDKLNEIKEKLPDPAKNAIERRLGNDRDDDEDDDDRRDRYGRERDDDDNEDDEDDDDKDENDDDDDKGDDRDRHDRDDD